ncbi:MAG: hypothetical protein MJ118_05540, partial [Clostridia bacterium]|nr:hypothetical protein [Clostridia bacterium]
SRIPTQEDVAAVRVLRSAYEIGSDRSCSDPQVIEDTLALHRTILENKKEEEKQQKRLQTDHVRGGSNRILLSYDLKNGKRVMREYDLCWSFDDTPCNAIYEQAGELFNCAPLVLLRNALPEDITAADFEVASISGPDKNNPERSTDYYLNAEDALAFYRTCVLPDLMDSSMGRSGFDAFDQGIAKDKYPIAADEPATTEAYVSPFYFYLSTKKGRCTMDIPEDAVRTLAFIENLNYFYNAK